MKIGYIGLGALGGALARRFLQEHDLTVWDLSENAVAAFEQLGAKVARTAADLARDCDVVLMCLPRSSDVRKLLFGPGGLAEGLSPGKLVIDQTSGIPAETRDMAARLAERGVTMIDAAVSATPQIVPLGSATLMVAGPEDAYARALPILHAITQTIHRCGSRVGDGQAMKMVNNAMNGVCRVGTLEVVAMGRKAGLSLEAMRDFLDKGWAANQTTWRMLPALVQGKASTDFAMALMLKDVDQAVSLGMDVDAPMPICSTLRSIFQVGLNTIGPKARLEEVVGLVESMAGIRLAQPAEVVPVQDSHTETDRLTIGYIGFDAKQDNAFARRLASAHKVAVFSTDRSVLSQWEREGAQIAADLPSLARGCDVIILSPANSTGLRDLIFGEAGLVEGLSAGKILIDHTAGDPADIRALAIELQALGVHVVDASPCPPGGTSGTDGIPVTCGGSPEAFSRARPLLDAISREITYCGPAGNGHLARVIYNAVAAVSALATHECAAAGIKYGLRIDDMATVLWKSSGWSGSSRRILENLAAGRRTGHYPLQMVVADLKRAARLSIDIGAPTMILNVVRSIFETGLNELGSDADADRIADLYETMAHVTLGSRA